jgi:hypothetical protein
VDLRGEEKRPRLLGIPMTRKIQKRRKEEESDK